MRSLRTPDFHPSEQMRSPWTPDFHPSEQMRSPWTPDFHPSEQMRSLGTPDLCGGTAGFYVAVKCKNVVLPWLISAPVLRLR